MDPQNDIRETSNKSIFDFSTLFAERGEMAFYSLLDLEVEMRSYQNHQTISNINEWDEMTFYAFKYIQICKSSHIMYVFLLIPFSSFYKHCERSLE